MNPGCCPSDTPGNEMYQRRSERSMPCERENREERSECPMPCRCEKREEQRERPMPCECEEQEKYSRRRCDQERDWRSDVPTCSRKQLLNYITEVSFVVYETLLFLDTHPDCEEALEHFRIFNEKRNFALEEYARLFGPLTVSTVNPEEGRSWKWVNEPWPWEGGDC